MSEKMIKTLHCAFLVIVGIVFILPLLWVVIASLDTNAGEALKWPAQWTFSNYSDVLTNSDNLRGFGVGLVISFAQSLIVVLISGLAAYPLSRYHLSYKKGFMYVILFMTALPMIAVTVPVYKIFLSVGLLDSIPGLVLFLSASSLPYGIWLMKNFMDGVPVELEEAAWIDGCSPEGTFFRIIFPLLKPVQVTVLILNGIWIWNDYLLPSLIINKPGWQTLPLKTYLFFGQFAKRWDLASAGLIMCIIPIIIFYLCCQKYIVKGITDGAIK